MSLFEALFGQFIDVIDWTDDTGDTLVRRFERAGNEIKYGAKLTVREGQAAAFVHEGRLADVFQPGLYKLHTNNLPLLSTLQHWDHGFESPFKSEVYFISTRRFTDLKWGTKNPVMLRDPEFGPIRLRAFGSYSMRVADPRAFLREIVGTDGEFTTHEISDQLRNVIVARFSKAIATSRIPALDLAANLDDLASFVAKRIAPELAQYGVEIVTLLIENISLPAEVERALDRRTAMGVVGDLRKYTQFQAAEALRASAEGGADGGALAAGAAVGAGLEMARSAAAALSVDPVAATGPASSRVVSPTPPPLPGAAPAPWHAALDGQATGPMDAADLRRLATEGRLTADSLVWRAGMGDWARAGDLALLAPLFTAPPPLPLPSGK